MNVIFGMPVKCVTTKIRDIIKPLPNFSYVDHKYNAFYIDNCYRFISIRNPFPWYVSIYSAKSPWEQSSKYFMNNNSFSQFVKDTTINQKDILRWFGHNSRIIKPIQTYLHNSIGLLSTFFIFHNFKEWQSILLEKHPDKFVLDNYDTLTKVDTIIKTENLKSETTAMLKKLNVNESFINAINFDTKINISKHDAFDVYYTSETKDIIKEKENLIIKLFYKKGEDLL